MPCRHRTGAIRSRRREVGSALLVTLLLATALLWAVSALVASVGDAGRTLRIRNEVLCARHAAAGALVVGLPANGRPDLVSDRVDRLTVVLLRHGRGRCVLRASARCGGAVRSAELPLDCSG